jgi:hypothetical protein
MFHPSPVRSLERIQDGALPHDDKLATTKHGRNDRAFGYVRNGFGNLDGRNSSGNGAAFDGAAQNVRAAPISGQLGLLRLAAG